MRGQFPAAIVLVAVVLAALTRSPALIVLAAATLGAWAIVVVTSRLALTALDADVVLSPDRLVAGETTTAVVTVVNRKPMPLPWLDVRLLLNEGIEPANAQPGMSRSSVGAVLAPRARERTVLRFPLAVPQRGAFNLGAVRLRSGDWLGFVTVDVTVPLRAQLVAYPRPLVAADRHVPSLRPLAETATKRGLLPDPLRFRGVREHRSGDARKEIHWKASARLRALQTKVYEPATSLDAIFLVNVASYEQYWIQADPEAAEIVVRAAAELIRAAASAGRQVGLMTNGIDGLTHERPRSALGRGPRALTRSLEILARLGPYASAAPEQVFLRERGRLPWGATLVIVTPGLTSGLAGAAVALRRAQHRVLVLSVNEPPLAAAAQLRGAGVTVTSLGWSEHRAAG